jgi:pilus assembly protein CpaC
LADLPWVGAAFRRVVEQNNEIELLITITPEFVGAMDADELPRQGPGASTRSPNDRDLYIRGRLEVPISGAIEISPREESHTEVASPPVFKQSQEVETVKPTGYVTPSGFMTTQEMRRFPPVVVDTTTNKRTPVHHGATGREPVIRMVGPLGYESLR